MKSANVIRPFARMTSVIRAVNSVLSDMRL
jgi:hypothetical protein